MKQFIKFFSITVIAFLFLTANSAFAEKVTFVKEYNYNASDLDSKVSSRTIALEQVKRLLLEELGVYLISETEVKNFRLTKDQVTTYSAGVVSAEVVDEKWDGKTYYLKAKVSADPDEVIKSLQNIINDKQKSKELEDVRKKAAEFSKEIERLKKELEIAKANSKTPEQRADTKKVAQYNKAVQGLSATDWIEKGYFFSKSGNYKEAINAYNKAIQLNPQFAEAYINRGVAYDNLGNYQQAINDFNKAIQLNPQLAMAYNNRGVAYDNLGNYQQAINDFNKAIKLDPQNALAYLAYNNRGAAYGNLGNYQQAINDFNKAIELNPQYANAYGNRGNAYAKSGNHQQAINDYNKAIELNPKLAEAYYNRGLAYNDLGNHQQAINNFNKAIELNPKDAEAYVDRGIAYHNAGKNQKAFNDYKIAAKLGEKRAQDFLRSQGIEVEQYPSQGQQQVSALCGDIEDCERIGLDYYKTGEYDKAIEIFSKMIGLRPFTISYFVHRGNCYLQKGDNASAISDFKYAAGKGDKGAQDHLKSKGIEW